MRTWTDPIGLALYRGSTSAEPSDDPRARRDLLAATAFCAARNPHRRRPLNPGRALRLLRRLAGPRLRPGVGVRGIFRPRSSSLLDLVVYSRSSCSTRRCPHARRRRRDGRADRVDDGELHEGRGRVDREVRCTVGMMERPERHDLSDRRRAARLLEPALWVLAVLSNLTRSRHRLHLARDARRGAPAHAARRHGAAGPVAVVAQSERRAPVRARADVAAAVEAYRRVT